MLELVKVIIGVTSIMFLEGNDWDRNRRVYRWCGRFFTSAESLGNCPETYAPLNGTGPAARRHRSGINSVWL